jgi:hypothetical protein
MCGLPKLGRNQAMCGLPKWGRAASEASGASFARPRSFPTSTSQDL